MNFVRRISVAAGLAALWLSLAAPASAAEEESEGEPPYPVWWSPALELDSLEAIDARLERQLWSERDEGMPLIKIEGDEREDVSAANCLELRAFDEQGYYGAGSHDQWVQAHLLAQCRAIEWMWRARPAERSFLRDFVLDEEAIHVLPAMVNAVGSCDFLCRQRVANERRIPLSRFEPVIKVTVKSSEEIKIQTIDWESNNTIVGRGDFNEDDLDDLLVLVSSGSISGTWGGAELYLLSRDTPDAVLFVAEELTNDCDDYPCDTAYDYPRVLRLTDPDFAGAAKLAARPRSITYGVTGGEEYPSDFLPMNGGAPYIVWWWPLMGVENRSMIDRLLDWEDWLTTDGTMLEIESAGEMVEVPAKSCRTLKKMLERGYRLTAGHRSHVSVIADCRALELLRDAQDAKASHLRDFVLDEGAIELLPSELWAAPSDADASALEIADERTLELRSVEGTRQIRFLAGGDFDGDGLDDVLVKRKSSGDTPEAAVFVLTRDTPDAPLRIVTAEVFRP